jgi:ABC-type transport system involved in cytochrome c biogenesis permease subunit
MKKWFPWVLAIVFAAWALSALRVPRDKTFAVNEFGKLPVMSGGRVQPIDSLARNSLLQIREKSRANLEPWKNWWDRPKLLSATDWAMHVMMKPEVADTWPVFRIDNPDVKSLLGLPGEADAARRLDGKHYSWQQIEVKSEELRRESARAAKKEAALQNHYERALLHLWEGRTTYSRLRNALGPARAGNLQSSISDFNARVEAGRAAWQAQMREEQGDEQALRWLSEQLEAPIIVPAEPTDPSRRTDNWRRVAEVVLRSQSEGGQLPKPVQSYAQIAAAFRAGDVPAFNRAVGEYRSWLASSFDRELRKSTREFRFNVAEPFYRALVIYVVGFVLALAYWILPGSEWLRRGAIACALVALFVHTGGLITRMVLEGRPPVTNLYSSAVFIGWGACCLGLVLEKFWRNSIGVVVSAGAGFITLIIAHHLSLSGDTMEMLQAVLDTNFWLATHVVVVTLGYASTFVAGLLGIAYVVRGLLTRAITPELSRSLSRMVFGIVCFATLFSFVGTVLGGIWADQSWGRFWGWDPKENGALIIVIWNVLILHARLGGLVRERGLMNLAIAGNIITAWSWFGVNMLGIGLHSYGFMSAAFWWLTGFVISQLVLIALGCIPLHRWKSFRANASAPSPSGDASPATA